MLSKIKLRWSRPRLAGRFYTVLILPHARSRFRKLHVSRAFVVTCSILLGVTLLAGVYSPHLLFRIETQQAALEQMANENERLRKDRDRFERTLAEIAGRLEEFESKSGRIATALGVEDLPSLQPAAGGPVAADFGPRRSVLDEELGAIQGRAERLHESLDEIGVAFEERIRLLASTPSIMPVEGWFSHGFGWRKDPFTNKRQFHRGVDIVSEPGTAVVAPADGVISRAVRVADYGKMVDVSHGFGFVTRYGHLSEILVRPGQRVRRGEIIGRVGSTGRSTGPHLHYEVFRDGRRVNPWNYLGQRLD